MPDLATVVWATDLLEFGIDSMFAEHGGEAEFETAINELVRLGMRDFIANHPELLDVRKHQGEAAFQSAFWKLLLKETKE